MVAKIANNRHNLSKALIERIAAGVRRGVPVRVFAESLGVPGYLVRQWLDEGRRQIDSHMKDGCYCPGAGKHEFMCMELAELVNEAAAKAFIRYQNKVDSAAKRDWKAALALMDRFYKEHQHHPSRMDAPPQATATVKGGGSGGAGVTVTLAFPDNGRGPSTGGTDG